MTDYERLEAQITAAAAVNARHYADSNISACIDAARAHLATLPRTKMIQVWRVDYAMHLHTGHWCPSAAVFRTDEHARHHARELDKQPDFYRCIRVTGPHEQEVPA